MRFTRNKKGMGLTVMVMIIAIAGFVFINSVKTFQSMMDQTQLRIDQTKAHYLAQAGVMRAIWDWYASSTTVESARRWSPLNTTVTGNQIFKVGSDSQAARLYSNFAQYIFKPKIQYVKNVATNQNKSNVGAAGLSLAATVPAAGVAKDNFIVVYFAIDDGAGAVTCADTQGNTYTKNSDLVFAAHVRAVIFTAPVTTALVSGNTITVSWPTATTAKAISVSEFSGVSTVDQQTSTAGTGTSTAPASANITTTQADSVLIGAIGAEGPNGDTFAAGASYTTNPPTRIGTTGSGAATNVVIDPEYRIVSATGTYNATGTLNGGVTARSWATVAANFYDPSENWFTSGSNKQLRNWRIKNINSGNSIVLTKVKISWTPTNAAVLNDFVLNGASKWPGGTFTSGSTIDITDTTLNADSSWGGTNTYIQWNAAPPDPVAVTCQFTYGVVAGPADITNSDLTSHEVEMWNGAQAGGGLPLERSFTVTSTGQVNQTAGGFKVMKTVKASVSSTPGTSALEITDWDEGDKNIP